MERTIGGKADLTVVTLTWNSREYVRTCVERTLLEAEKAGLKCEFFIVDNGSEDDTLAVLSQLEGEHPEVRTWRLSRNRGTTVPRNIALRQASGRFVCILDSDAYPGTGCLRRLVDVVEKEPTVGIAVPRIIYPDGRYQKSVDRFPTLQGKLRRALLLRRIEAASADQRRGTVPYAISAFWVLRRQVVEQVGLFDERIFYAPEDADYCLSVWEKGYSVFYEPDAVAVHDAQEKSRTLMPGALTFMHFKGLALFFLKHRFLFREPMFGQKA